MMTWMSSHFVLTIDAFKILRCWTFDLCFVNLKNVEYSDLEEGNQTLAKFIPSKTWSESLMRGLPSIIQLNHTGTRQWKETWSFDIVYLEILIIKPKYVQVSFKDKWTVSWIRIWWTWDWLFQFSITFIFSAGDAFIIC